MSRSFSKFDQIISKNDTNRVNNRITAQVGASLGLRPQLAQLCAELGQIWGPLGQIDQFFRGRGQKTIFSKLSKNVLTSSSEKSIICFVKLKNKAKKGEKEWLEFYLTRNYIS